MEQTYTFTVTSSSSAVIYLAIPPNIAKARILDARATQSDAAVALRGILTLASGSTTIGTLQFASAAAAGAIATYTPSTTSSADKTLVVGASTAIKCTMGGASTGWGSSAIITLSIDYDEFGRAT